MDHFMVRGRKTGHGQEPAASPLRPGAGSVLVAKSEVSNRAFAATIHLLAEFTEVETGKGADALDRRQQLKAALKAAKVRSRRRQA